MDAETRHQLKTNDLAEALARLRDFRDPRLTYGLVAICAIIIGLAAWYAFNAYRRHTLEGQWQRLGALTEPLAAQDAAKRLSARDDLEALISQASHPTLLGFARLKLADALVREAVQDESQRPGNFPRAAEILEVIRRDPRTPRDLYAAATFGLASVKESLRDFAGARTLYEELTRPAAFPGSPYEELATARLQDLDKLVDLPELVAGERPPVTPPQFTLQPPVLTPAPPVTLPPVEAPSSEPAAPENASPSVDEPASEPPAEEPATEPGEVP